MKNVEKFARRCDVTQKGMNEGFVIGDGDYYIASQDHLLEHLKTLDWVNAEGKQVSEIGLSDDDLMEYFFNEGYYYHTEWQEISDDYYYTEDGEEVEYDGEDQIVTCTRTKMLGGKEYQLVPHAINTLHTASEKENVVRQLKEMGFKVRCLDASGYPNKGEKYSIWIRKNNN